MTRRLVVGISGASGAIYAIRLLEVLRRIEDVETHLVMSTPGKQTIVYETGMAVRDVEALADVTYRTGDISAAIASGSYRTAGMIVAPCSMRTVGAIAASLTDNLLTRAADVTLKERRRLVLLVRETPFHIGHLRLLTQVAEYGAIVMPPVPAFYTRPQSLDDIVNQTVGRALDQLDIDVPPELFDRWNGLKVEG
jgi:4-hydroxy-3-polyprenylbenzoate decarboxylase